MGEMELESIQWEDASDAGNGQNTISSGSPAVGDGDYHGVLPASNLGIYTQRVAGQACNTMEQLKPINIAENIVKLCVLAPLERNDDLRTDRLTASQLLIEMARAGMAVGRSTA